MLRLLRRIIMLAFMLIAASMLCGLSAFADTPASGGMHTVTVSTDVTTPHTYEIVQVMTGDSAEDAIVNPKWGKDVDGDGIMKDAAKESSFNSSGTVSSLMKSVTEKNAEKFAEIVNDHVKSVYEEAEINSGSVKFTVPDGFYLVRGKDSGKTFKPFLLWVRGKDVSAAAKPSFPSVTKQVQNDFFVTDGTWTAAGTAQKAHFKVRFTVPDTTGYDQFVYRIHDVMSGGLSFDQESLKINGLDTKYYTVKTGENGDTFTVDVDALQAVKDGKLLKGQPLYMTYDGIVNTVQSYREDLTETNAVSLEYSDSSFHTVRTEESKVKVIIPVITLHKVDAKTQKPLKHAAFVLKNGKSVIPVHRISEGVYSVNAAGPSKAGDMLTDDKGNITLLGVPLAKKDTPLTLEEVSAPKGYNRTVKGVPLWFEGSGNPAEAVRLLTTGSPDGLAVKEWGKAPEGRCLESKDASFTVTLFDTPETGTGNGKGKSGGGKAFGIIPKTGDDVCRLIAMTLIFLSAAGLLVKWRGGKKKQF